MLGVGGVPFRLDFYEQNRLDLQFDGESLKFSFALLDDECNEEVLHEGKLKYAGGKNDPDSGVVETTTGGYGDQQKVVRSLDFNFGQLEFEETALLTPEIEDPLLPLELPEAVSRTWGDRDPQVGHHRIFSFDLAPVSRKYQDSWFCPLIVDSDSAGLCSGGPHPIHGDSLLHFLDDGHDGWKKGRLLGAGTFAFSRAQNRLMLEIKNQGGLLQERIEGLVEDGNIKTIVSTLPQDTFGHIPWFPRGGIAAYDELIITSHLDRDGMVMKRVLSVETGGVWFSQTFEEDGSSLVEVVEDAYGFPSYFWLDPEGNPLPVEATWLQRLELYKEFIQRDPEVPYMSMQALTLIGGPCATPTWFQRELKRTLEEHGVECLPWVPKLVPKDTVVDRLKGYAVSQALQAVVSQATTQTPSLTKPLALGVAVALHKLVADPRVAYLMEGATQALLEEGMAAALPKAMEILRGDVEAMQILQQFTEVKGLPEAQDEDPLLIDLSAVKEKVKA